MGKVEFQSILPAWISNQEPPSRLNLDVGIILCRIREFSSVPAGKLKRVESDDVESSWMVTIYLLRFIPIGSPKLTHPSRLSLDFDLSPCCKVRNSMWHPWRAFLSLPFEDITYVCIHIWCGELNRANQATISMKWLLMTDGKEYDSIERQWIEGNHPIWSIRGRPLPSRTAPSSLHEHILL